jgi:spermidine/putrescine transport system substrate-binding protein
LSRRQLLAIMAGVTCGTAFEQACSLTKADGSDKRTLIIFGWADYLHPDTIPEFERRFGLKVFLDTFASNEAMLAKLQISASQYDIVLPSSYALTNLIAMGLVSALDHERIKNINLVSPRFFHMDYDKNLNYSIPYTWGTTGIGYSKSKFESVFKKSPTPFEDGGENAFDLFWNPAFSGRITLLDDARETIGMSLARQGHSYNSTNQGEVKSATRSLIEQKPLTMCFTSDQVIIQLASSDSWLALAFSGDVYQAGRVNRDVGYAVPPSGSSIWVDSFAIPKGARHVDNAYLWLNFMLEPAIAVKNALYTFYPTPNSAAFNLIDDNLKKDPNLYPGEEILQKCEEIRDLGRGVFIYDAMWTELKCA